MTEIVAAVLGGFLAGLVGWFTQYQLEERRIQESRRLFIAGVLDDLASSTELYKRIAEDWERSQVVYFSVITELDDSRHAYTSNRNHVLLIPSADLRKRIAAYYRKSALHLLSLRNFQQRKYDIDAQYLAGFRQYKLANPATDDDVVRYTVLGTMTSEAKELEALNAQLPSLVAGLHRFALDAQSLSTDLAALPEGK